MTLKRDAKFKEKMTCSFKYDMRNLVNFHPTKSEDIFSIDSFCPKYTRFKLQKYSYLTWHWTVMPNLNTPWPCGFKNGVANWVNFHQNTQKSEIMYFDGLFFSKAYDFLARKFHRTYVSWHRRVMQNLKEDWLMAW